MIEQNVQIVRCQDERLWVRLGSQSGCSACDDGKGCGAGLFAKLIRQKPVVLELPQKGLSVVPGQMLTLAFPERVYIKLVLTSYGWPLLAALAGGMAGHSLGMRYQWAPVQIDMSTLLCGLLGSAIVMHLVRKRHAAGDFFNGLQSLVYYPAVTPNMCSRSDPEITGDDGS
jgi:positive regulator of sigma E activity